jgi:hypothetical protein
MKKIVELTFGSHLYGTNTETSDDDVKGIFMPDFSDILLGRIPKTSHSIRNSQDRKNKPGELDAEFYSLHHFLKLAQQGQTVAIDMLWAPPRFIRQSSEIWEDLQSKRENFLSKNMHAFVGYARGQAAKYSMKGKRLEKLRKFQNVLGKIQNPTETRLERVWDELPRDSERVNANGIKELQISGKWFGATTTILSVYFAVDRLIKRYGRRASEAADALGVDWKAMSHAVRVSRELIELLMFKHIEFPLKDSKWLLLPIKRGEMSLEEVEEILDEDLRQIEYLIDKSDLPEKVDYKFWDEWLAQTVMDHISDEIVSLMRDGTE